MQTLQKFVDTLCNPFQKTEHEPLIESEHKLLTGSERGPLIESEHDDFDEFLKESPATLDPATMELRFNYPAEDIVYSPRERLLVSKERDHDQAIIEETNGEIAALTHKLNDLNEMISDLNVMIVPQGTTLDKITDHVEVAATHVEQAIVELDTSMKEKFNGIKLMGGIIAVILTTIGTGIALIILL